MKCVYQVRFVGGSRDGTTDEFENVARGFIQPHVDSDGVEWVEEYKLDRATSVEKADYVYYFTHARRTNSTKRWSTGFYVPSDGRRITLSQAFGSLATMAVSGSLSAYNLNNVIEKLQLVRDEVHKHGS